MSYSIHRAVIPTDIDELVRVRELAMHDGEGEEPIRTIYEDVDRRVAFLFQRNQGLGLVLEDKTTVVWKVVDNDSGEIVSWFSITPPHRAEDTQEQKGGPKTVSPPQGTKIELRNKFLDICDKADRYYGYDPEKDYASNQMITHPSHQHRGLATRLLRHVLEHVDRDGGARYFSDCWPRSQPLFEKPEFGFRCVSEQDVDLRPYGKGLVRNRLYIREARGGGG